jgi:hypothetical protein
MKFIHAETNVFAITRIKVCHELKYKNNGKIRIFGILYAVHPAFTHQVCWLAHPFFKGAQA